MLNYRSTRARFAVVGLAFIGLAAAGWQLFVQLVHFVRREFGNRVGVVTGRDGFAVVCGHRDGHGQSNT